MAQAPAPAAVPAPEPGVAPEPPAPAVKGNPQLAALAAKMEAAMQRAAPSLGVDDLAALNAVTTELKALASSG